MPVTICIDGPAGAGKSTMSKLVAKRLGFTYLDTGAIYRSLAYSAARRNVSNDDEDALATLAQSLDLRFIQEGETPKVILSGEDVTEQIRTPEMSRGASEVSRHPKVRAGLLDLQRAIAAKESIVAEGRDTGTVVFPKAELKIYLDASLNERARRRFGDYQNKGVLTSLEEVKAEIKKRDEADSTRKSAPLKAAADAVTLDTTNLSPEAVVEQIVAMVEKLP